MDENYFTTRIEHVDEHKVFKLLKRAYAYWSITRNSGGAEAMPSEIGRARPSCALNLYEDNSLIIIFSLDHFLFSHFKLPVPGP